MSQLDQDWSVVKQELVDLKSQNASLKADNAALAAKVPSDQTAAEIAAEAASVVPVVPA